MALTGVFPKPGESVPSGPLTLCRCKECGLVQLGENYNPDLLYGETYGYRSGLNPSMVEHLTEILVYINEKRGHKVYDNDSWLDIGSNDGTLLSELPSGFRMVGVDPLADKFAQHYPRGAQFIPAAFHKDQFSSNEKFKVITSIAMFYDLEEPVQFAHDIYDILDDDGVWYTEQAYLPAMIYNNAYDSICHEHLSYYRLQDIANIAAMAGFYILDVRFNDVNGGSFGVLLGKKGKQWGMLQDTLEIERGMRLDHLIGVIKDHPKQVQTLLGELEGRNIFGYGASTKGNVVLQHCGVTHEQVHVILDANEEKEGRVTPGTNIPICYDEGRDDPSLAPLPEYLLVLPWHFREFILEKEKAARNAGVKFIFLLPELEIV